MGLIFWEVGKKSTWHGMESVLFLKTGNTEQVSKLLRIRMESEQDRPTIRPNPAISPEFKALLQSCLILNPTLRCSADDILKRPRVKQYMTMREVPGMGADVAGVQRLRAEQASLITELGKAKFQVMQLQTSVNKLKESVHQEKNNVLRV